MDEGNPTMKIEYVVKRKGRPHIAEVLQGGKIIADLDESKDFVSVLTTMNGRTYYFTPRVDGKIIPFSIMVYESNDSQRKTILKIKGNCFSHGGQMYMIGAIPEGKSAKDIGRSKYICRLVNFPFDDMDKIDMHVREKLGRYRGIEVGQLSGLGSIGHKITLDEELEEISLPLSVSSYLIYSTG
ncbi:MAG: hypothetical protein OK439_03665 [Thaumarchaeota archaeon]|nr:hypothetical protein [Nitrososphaerota archaeon]